VVLQRRIVVRKIIMDPTDVLKERCIYLYAYRCINGADSLSSGSRASKDALD